MNDNFDLSSAIELIKSFESCATTAYKDIVGVWTIGWGKTSNVKEGDTCTQEEADQWLLDDVESVSNQIQKVIKREVNENQFNAILSFTYNLGIGSLLKSTLLRYLNGGEANIDIANEFLKWDYAGGKEVEGLERRRVAERLLFLS